MKKFLFFTALLFSGLLSHAQIKLTGNVFDHENKALPGASVVLSGTRNGTITNDKGHFSLSLPQGSYTIKVSFMGYIDHRTMVELKNDQHLTIILEQDHILTEEVFVYATRAGLKTPVTASNLTRQQIADRNLGQDVPYLLNTTPSFVSSSDAGTGVGYTAFRIRGTDANRINVTVNGIPLNDAESHGVWWVNMPDFSSSVDNIQVQRGVGTSTHGASAFGASINMQTSSLSKDAYAEYNGSGGSFNTFKNTVKVGSGLINNHFSIDARLSKISSDGFIDRAWSNLKSFYVSAGYYSNNTILKANVFSGLQSTYQAWNGVPSVRLNNDLEGMKRYGEHGLISATQTEEMIASNNRTYNIYTYENETDNYQQDHYQLLLSYRISPRLNLNLAGHYTRGKGYYEQFKPNHKLSNYGLEPIKIGETSISRTDIIRRKWLDNHFYGNTFSLVYQSTKSDITIGGGWNHYVGHHYGDLIWMRHAGNLDKGAEWYRNFGQKTDFNGYLKYNYALTDWLNTFVDLQYRGIDFAIEGNDDNLRNITQNHQFNFFNPKLGLFVQPDQNQKAFITWAIANREPNRGNYTDADPAGKQPVAERLNDFEAGYTASFSRFSWGVNAYLMSYRDQLILTGMINDVGDPVMTNVENSYRTGIELLGGVKITQNLSWEINLTLSRNKIIGFTEYVDNWDTWGQDQFDLGNTDIAFSPNAVMNSQLKFEPVKNLSLLLLSHYVGKQYIDNSMSNDRKLDPYFINNIKASYTLYPKLVKELRFSLMVNNLLNAKYESNAWVYSYIYNGTRYSMDGYFPQAGTHFLMGIDIRF